MSVTETVPVRSSVFDLVGNTPLLHIGSAPGGGRLLVKLEGLNPTGSVKDRACAHILREAQAAGALASKPTLIDASSGNFACSLAYFGRVLGLDVRVVSGAKLTAEKRSFIEWCGATLETTGAFTIDGNRACRERVAAEPASYYFTDQLHNDLNVVAHHVGTGREITSAAPDVEVVVGSLGSGGTLCGVARHLSEAHSHVQIVAVEAAAGARIPGAGAFVDGDYVTPFIEELNASSLALERMRISESVAYDRCLDVRKHGVFGGLQSGAVIEAAITSEATAHARGDVVVILGDSGFKNLDRLTRHSATN